jgi:hypothetical protein
MAAEYDKLSTAIIQRFIQMLGATEALKQARRVPRLEVAPDGTVLSAVSLTEFSMLVRQYKSVGGSISVYFMKSAIAPLAPSGTILPEELR